MDQDSAHDTPPQTLKARHPARRSGGRLVLQGVASQVVRCVRHDLHRPQHDRDGHAVFWAGDRVHQVSENKRDSMPTIHWRFTTIGETVCIGGASCTFCSYVHTSGQQKNDEFKCPQRGIQRSSPCPGGYSINPAHVHGSAIFDISPCPVDETPSTARSRHYRLGLGICCIIRIRHHNRDMY